MYEFETQVTSSPATRRNWRRALLMGASAVAVCSVPAAALAQQTTPSPVAVPTDTGAAATAEQVGGGTGATKATGEEATDIVVTGVRASLQRSRDIKRTSSGVVDAISAEEMGKFPDTNLAESLQRVPGVSIERRAGEGATVTVRGFGPQFNLVTVNGRQLATTDVNAVGGDQGVDFGRATSRSFDFSNLASEGVSRLEVYKTGRAAIPSGGIGAAINVVTNRPLDGHGTGLNGSIGVKALYDLSLDSKVTPETSGVLNWSNPDKTVGVSLFGSYSQRKGAAASSTVNDWNITPFSAMPGRGPNTIITNAPTDPNHLVAIPNDSRYHYSEFDRKRLNLSGTLQFKPIETLTLTGDALYATNKLAEQRSDQTNWFNRPFDHVTFDSDPSVATAIYLDEGSGYTSKDIGFEQQYRATKTKLTSYGLNANWEIAHGVTLNLDGNTSKSSTRPNSSNGASSTLVSLGAPVVDAHSVDFTGPIPQQHWVFNDCYKGSGTTIRGNCNGVLDVGDLGTQVQRTNASAQTHKVVQGRADLGWDIGGGARFDVGATRIKSTMISTQVQTQQQLGDWGIGNVGDVKSVAGNLIQQFCLQCQFDTYQPTDATIAFRGNALDLYNAFAPYYANLGNPIKVTGINYDRVKERVTAFYGQFTWKGDLGNMPAGLVAGARYETTKVNSYAVVTAPTGIVWDADNDFSRILVPGANSVVRNGAGKYNNFLPSVDFKLEPMHNLVARVSASKTLARADYGNLFVSESANPPNRPTYLGGVATGSKGDANLKPLVSTNFDASLEYYYARSSYVSAGFFYKSVKNFVGQGVFNQPLFGLRDPSSGAPGTLSGIAVTQLNALSVPISDVSLFTYAALLQQNNNSVALATQQFLAKYDPITKQLDQVFVDDTLKAVNISASPNDPLFSFAVTQPINNRTGKVHGIELQAQHFFGDTGFGFAASLTKVLGDVKFDNGSSPGTNVFALTGLSDSANATGIFEKNGFSARVSYNWRGTFLASVNNGGSRNPRYFAPYGTVDMSLSYDLNKHLGLSFEGVNLLSEPLRVYGRSKRQVFFVQEGHPRFFAGARYRF